MTISDEAAVDLLTAMLETPGLCGQEEAIGELLLRTMADAGFATARDDVGNVIGSPARKRATHDRTVLILGHLDTVPGLIPVERRDGVLYGRGAVDARGPLAAAVVAAARARGAGVNIVVAGAVQEEGPSLGARRIAEQPAPDYLIIAEPSGWDAVVLGYKGSHRFTVEIRQPCAHSAGPGPTAPERAVAFWNALVVWCAAQTAEVPARSGAFYRLTPILVGMSSESDGLHQTASLQVGLRLPPGQRCEEVEAGVRSLAPDAAFRFAPGEPAVRGERNTPLVAAFLRAIRAEQATPRFKLKTGTSDMNVVGPVWQCPMLAYGPGDSRLDHTPNEHIRIDEYLGAIRVLTRVLEEL